MKRMSAAKRFRSSEMRHVVQPNGNLLIIANNEDRSLLADAYRTTSPYSRAEMLISEAFHEVLTFIAPENIGALTEAPILCDDVDFPDDANGFVPYDETSRVWWFPNYMVTDPWEELKNKGRVEFTLAK
jgi:hypothetical protein